VVFTLLWLRHQSDAQGALFVFMLPFLHVAMTMSVLMLWRLLGPPPR
jgi:hypothetical protein